jgi:hypothetical protein
MLFKAPAVETFTFYFAGHGIATCEDIVTVTESGAEFLSRSQDRLWLVGMN